MFERTVKHFLNSPHDLRLVCGIAVGYPDEARPENLCCTERDDPLQSYEIRQRDEAQHAIHSKAARARPRAQ
jgi:hypothetical protein